MQIPPIPRTSGTSEYANRSTLARPVKYHVKPLNDEFMPVVDNVCYPSYASDSFTQALCNARYLADRKVTNLMRSGVRARSTYEKVE